MSRLLRKQQYMSSFCLHTVHLSGPETRQIRLHLLKAETGLVFLRRFTLCLGQCVEQRNGRFRVDRPDSAKCSTKIKTVAKI